MFASSALYVQKQSHPGIIDGITLLNSRGNYRIIWVEPARFAFAVFLSYNTNSKATKLTAIAAATFVSTDDFIVLRS